MYKGVTNMLGIIMPPEKYDPILKKRYEIHKKKHLKWAKKHGCYNEVKKYYEMQEWLKEHVTY